VYGLIYGLRTSPNRHPRILVNSVLNGSGKYGAKVGNAAGVLALVYTLVERQMEDVGLDTLPRTLRYHTGIDVGRWLGSDAALPALSAFATGMLFTLPRASEWVWVCGRGGGQRVSVLLRPVCAPIKPSISPPPPPPSGLTTHMSLLLILTDRAVWRVYVCLCARVRNQTTSH